MSCTTSQKKPRVSKSFQKRNAKWFQGVGSPKLLLVQTPQNHIIQIAEMFFLGGKCIKIMLEENLGTCPILNNSSDEYQMISMETLVLVQGPQNHN